MPKLTYSPHRNGAATLNPETYRTINETAKELCEEMKAAYGNFMIISEIIDYLKCGKDYVQKLLRGIQYVQTGKAKRYRTIDVARRLAEKMAA